MDLYGDALINAPAVQTGNFHAKREAAATYFYLFGYSCRGGGSGGASLGPDVPRPPCEELPYVLGAPLLREGGWREARRRRGG